jgi:hypothetical protein
MGSRRGKLRIQRLLPAGFARITKTELTIGRIGLIELDLLVGVPPWGYNRHFQVHASKFTKAASMRRVCQGVCEMDGNPTAEKVLAARISEQQNNYSISR